MSATDPPLSPDAPTARRWLQDELAKPEYRHHESIIKRFLSWLSERLASFDVSLGDHGPRIPGWLIATVVLLGLVVGLMVSYRRFRPTSRTATEPKRSSAAIFDDALLTADDYLAQARQRLETDPSAALVAAYRAVVTRAAERSVIELAPTTTVADATSALCSARPDEAEASHSAGTAFEAVRYGNHQATRAQVDDTLALERRLSSGTYQPIAAEGAAR